VTATGKLRRALLVSFALLCAGSSGCAGFWDEVTRNDFSLKHYFNKPSPLVVLAREDNSGTDRQKALLALREPKQYGGTDTEQDTVVQVLVTAAKSEPFCLARLGAVESLAHFKDPRAVVGLKDAYYADVRSFNPQLVSILHCKILDSLGQTKQPEAIDLLVTVLNQPPLEGAEEERQYKMDERIAAAHALGQFKHYRAATELARVLETEQDIALRNTSTESLRTMTGKNFPPDAQVWNDYLHRTRDKNGDVPYDPSLTDKVFELVSWWSK
jgi:hypothetical protein